jgi:two-component system response regulator HydG
LLNEGGLIGKSAAMQELAQLLTKVATTDATVLITGESGTGKELVARAVHSRSQRMGSQFVAVNCAAVPETLLESELFGHTRGAFTHATNDKKGLFEQAAGGTLFLDELADIPLDVQAKLLRALQERRVRPLGATEERDVDVRLLAATNKSLENEVSAGRFRKDLYYRVHVVEVTVPPLRDRDDDVLLIAHHFIGQMAARAGKSLVGLSPEASDALFAYEWPGNVRELQSCIARAVTLAEGTSITLVDLPPVIQAACEKRTTLPPVMDRESLPRLSDVERRYIRHVLQKTSGNKTRAAEVLGIDRRTLHRKLKRMRQPSKLTFH